MRKLLKDLRAACNSPFWEKLPHKNRFFRRVTDLSLLFTFFSRYIQSRICSGTCTQHLLIRATGSDYEVSYPCIRDIKGKETQTRNNWTLMETSLAESQTDIYFPTKWPNGYPKQKDVSESFMPPFMCSFPVVYSCELLLRTCFTLMNGKY